MNDRGLRTETLIRRTVAIDKQLLVRTLLQEQCNADALGNNGWSGNQMERIWFAVLKVGGNDIAVIKGAVHLARQDWRDLLTAAGFHEDPSAHEAWWAEVCG